MCNGFLGENLRSSTSTDRSEGGNLHKQISFVWYSFILQITDYLVLRFVSHTSVAICCETPHSLSLSEREWGGLFTNPDHRHFLRIRAIIFIRKFALIHLKLCHMYFILPVIFRDLDNSEPLSLTSFILEDSKFSLRKKLWKNKQPGNINKVMHFKKDNDWTRLTKINTFSRPRNYTIEDHTGYPYRKIQSSTSSYANNKLVHMWFTHRINKLDDKRR